MAVKAAFSVLLFTDIAVIPDANALLHLLALSK